MSSLRTFISALKTGETRTTKALDKLAAHRRGIAAAGLIAMVSKPGSMKAPLKDPLRSALRAASLPEKTIEVCIDGWPDKQKETMRRAVAKAIREGRRVRFHWGLTSETGFRTQIHDTGTGIVKITALTPRSALRSHADGSVDAMPAG
jgi:hypothetical protein